MKKNFTLILLACMLSVAVGEELPYQIDRLMTLRNSKLEKINKETKFQHDVIDAEKEKEVEKVNKITLSELDKLKKKYLKAQDLKAANAANDLIKELEDNDDADIIADNKLPLNVKWTWWGEQWLILRRDGHVDISWNERWSERKYIRWRKIDHNKYELLFPGDTVVTLIFNKTFTEYKGVDINERENKHTFVSGAIVK